MKRINARDFTYVNAILIIPIILLFKGFYSLAFVGFLLLALLLIFDPVCQRFRKQIDEANLFLKVNLSTALVAGAGIYVIPDFGNFFIFLWFLIDFVFAYKIAKNIDKSKPK